LENEYWKVWNGQAKPGGHPVVDKLIVIGFSNIFILGHIALITHTHVNER